MDLPPDPSVYFAVVWQIVQQIPSGAVSTYGQIASMIPAPSGMELEDYERLGPRWVGKAMNAVSAKDDPAVPWQRVINSQGGISLPEGSRAAVEQRLRLEREGHTFDKRDRVNLNQVGWDGPDDSWLAENRLYKPRRLKKPPESGATQLTLF